MEREPIMPASETALPTGDVAPRCELAGEWDVEASVRRGRLRLLATRGSSMQGETSSSLSAENMLAPQLDPKLLYDLLLTDRWVYSIIGSPGHWPKGVFRSCLAFVVSCLIIIFIFEQVGVKTPPINQNVLSRHLPNVPMTS